jgi:hypothetical protein
MTAPTPHGNQFFIPGWGFACLLMTAKNDYFIPGWGFICEFNNYQSASTEPFLIGWPA